MEPRKARPPSRPAALNGPWCPPALRDFCAFGRRRSRIPARILGRFRYEYTLGRRYDACILNRGHRLRGRKGIMDSVRGKRGDKQAGAVRLNETEATGAKSKASAANDDKNAQNAGSVGWRNGKADARIS